MSAPRTSLAQYRPCTKLYATIEGSSPFRTRLTILAATSDQRQRKLFPADSSFIPMVQDLRRPGQSEVLARPLSATDYCRESETSETRQSRATEAPADFHPRLSSCWRSFAAFELPWSGRSISCRVRFHQKTESVAQVPAPGPRKRPRSWCRHPAPPSQQKESRKSVAIAHQQGQSRTNSDRQRKALCKAKMSSTKCNTNEPKRNASNKQPESYQPGYTKQQHCPSKMQ